MPSKRSLLWDWTNTGGANYPGVPQMIDKVNFNVIRSVSNWNTWVPPELKGRAPFRPMVRTEAQLNGQDWQNVINSHESIVHFFNEPERAGISPEHAADLWRQHMVPLRNSSGKKLVSPSCANDQNGQNWINKWMSLVNDSPPNYLGLHYYGTDINSMKNFLHNMHSLHSSQQVIVSEWACISRNYQDVLHMTVQMADWMDEQDWIFEHALFGCMRKVADNFVSPVAQLMNPDGSFTDLFLKYESPASGSSGSTRPPPVHPPSPLKWTVRAKDTLLSISKILGTSVEALESVNKGIDPKNLKVGQVIKLPPTYIIKAGDTLWSISRRIGTTVEAIEAANPGINIKNLQIGRAVWTPETTVRPLTWIKAGSGWWPVKEEISPIPDNAEGIITHPKGISDPPAPQTINKVDNIKAVQSVQPLRHGDWTIQEGDTQWSIEKAGGISLEGIRSPESTISGAESDHSKVLNGAEKVHEFMASYIVKQGDTLWAIAQEFHTTVNALESANPGVAANNLRPGEIIKIPGGNSPHTVQHYTIKQGDTFFSIASAFKISVGSLEAANPGVNPSQLHIGQVIRVPGSESLPSGNPHGPGSSPGGGKVQYGGPASHFPDPHNWASWEYLWNQNSKLMKFHDSDGWIDLIKNSILTVAKTSGVDARAILCIIMQESGGNPTVNATSNGVNNPGLMQSHNGVSFDPAEPARSILQMIKDGTEGTRDGPGLKQLLAQYHNYYSAFRAYNSGSVDPNDLNNGLGATPSYVNDVANRLMGHSWSGM